MRHFVLYCAPPLLGKPAVTIRREYPDGGKAAYWGGREFGWSDEHPAKRFTSKAGARAALARILAHERALGLHNRVDGRY
jgi:hypothetical protein